MTTFYERYMQGEYELVWTELCSKGDEIRQEPLFADALSVATETMKRVRHNIELLRDNLSELGYKFGIYPDGRTIIYGYTEPINNPTENVQIKVMKMEKLEGINSFPLSLRLFWEIVGDVNFIGYHPSFPKYSDPIVVYPIDTLIYEYTTWQEQKRLDVFEAGEYFEIPLSPDYLHKENVSGGNPYMVRVPNFGIDAILENERHNTTFVNYLRTCFRYGGFPGLQWHEGVLPDELSQLNKKLIPI